MRILFVVEAMGGGIFTYIVGLANELCKENDVFIAYGIRKQTPLDYQEYFNKKIHLIKIEHFTRKISLINDIRSAIEIKRVADQVNPDIIHLHSSKAGVLGRIIFSGRKNQLFYTPHGYSFLMENYNAIRRMGFKLIERICAKRRCITISCSYGEYLEALKIDKHACYVNNGINTEEIESCIKQYEGNQEKRTVFTLGRICSQKNPKLFNSIAEAMPEMNFVWIGDGELRGDLQSNNIFITGWLDRKDALTIASKADVFLLTSLWEGLPMSLLEAMYIKKLCVVSDIIGNHDVIKNGKNGYTCISLDQYVNAIKNVNSPDIFRVINQAHDDIVAGYTIKVMAKRYSEIYEKSLAEEVNIRYSFYKI